MTPSPPFDLKCESLRNPLGLSQPHPAFSWFLRSEERGDEQSAYQILVSSERELGEKEIGDFWDSGKVASPKSFLIPYRGDPLAGCERYYWRVRWWDKQGRMSPWSETARFETAFFSERDWKAKWIALKSPREFRSRGSTLLGEYGGDYIQAYAVYLRREFALTEKAVQATIFICGLGYFELSLNGRKVGDRVLDPAWTEYRKVSLYSAFDILGDLRDKNCVGVILGSGRHIKNYGYDLPKLTCRIEVEYESGAREIIVSDESWKAASGPLQDNGLYCGERYDARLEIPGWNEPGFYDSSWEAAVTVPGYPLAPQIMPPIRVEKKLRPKASWSPHPDVHVFDFGQNFSGWARLSVEGPRGTAVKLRYAELIHEDGTLNMGPTENAESTDVYILKGIGREVYEPRFTYHGFRYVEITGFPGSPGSEALEACFVHSDVERTGSFSCSHDLINRIHQNTLWGQLSNLMSIPTDCPQRDERFGWLADAHLAAEESIFNFDMAAFYGKFLEDIRLSQKEDGSLPDVAPCYLPRFYPADPAWGSAYVLIAWDMYFYYGDARLIERHYLPLKKYVDYLGKAADAGIIRNLGKYGDWCQPGAIIPKKTPLELTSTWFYYLDLFLLSQMAKVVGRMDDSLGYKRLAESVKEAFNGAFLGNGQYSGRRMSPVDDYPDQTSNVLPLHLGMVPEEQKREVLDSLARSVGRIHDGHLDTGILGTCYLLDVLVDNGHEDLAWKVVTQKSYPGWGYMIQEGATTLWERWEKLAGNSMNSHNHIMLGSVDAWFYKHLAGLCPLEPGWKTIRIRPRLAAFLASAEASVITPLGEVRVRWRNDARIFELETAVPLGASARIFLPLFWDRARLLENEKVVWEAGNPVGKPDNLLFEGIDGHALVYRTGSGSYRFVLERTD